MAHKAGINGPGRSCAVVTSMLTNGSERTSPAEGFVPPRSLGTLTTAVDLNEYKNYYDISMYKYLSCIQHGYENAHRATVAD